MITSQLKIKDHNNNITFKERKFVSIENLYIYIEKYNSKTRSSWKNIIDFNIE